MYIIPSIITTFNLMLHALLYGEYVNYQARYTQISQW